MDMNVKGGVPYPVIMVTCKLLTLIRFSCLHLGQNKGNFFNIVSFLILSRVLLPQTGHRIHSAVFASIHYLYNSAFIAVSCLFLAYPESLSTARESVG